MKLSKQKVFFLVVVLLSICGNSYAKEGFLSFMWRGLKEDARLMWLGAKSGIYTVGNIMTGNMVGAGIEVAALGGVIYSEYHDGESNPLSVMAGHGSNAIGAITLATAKVTSDITGDEKWIEKAEIAVSVYEVAMDVKELANGSKFVTITEGNAAMNKTGGIVPNYVGRGKTKEIIAKSGIFRQEVQTVMTSTVQGVEYILEGIDDSKNDDKNGNNGMPVKNPEENGASQSAKPNWNSIEFQDGNYIFTDKENKLQMCISENVLNNIVNQSMAEANKQDGNLENSLPVDAPRKNSQKSGKPSYTPLKAIEVHKR